MESRSMAMDMDNLRDELAKENIALSSSTDRKVLDVQPESRHECSICLSWLQEPHLTSCGHRFCKDCITVWLQHKDYCPVDNAPIKESDLFPDNYTKREILEQRTMCPFAINGCAIQVAPIELESHIATCEFKNSNTRISLRSKVACTFKDLGCDAILKNEEVLTNHLESNLQQHLRLLMNAYSKIMLDRNMQNISLNSSMEQEATCLWDPEEKRNESDTSTQSNNSSKSEQCSSIKELVRSLYEKVVLLEQRNREQDITIGNLLHLVMAMKSNQQRVSEDLSLKYCMGCYVWKIDNFTSKLDMMLNDPSKTFYSSGFYTSPNGYRFCARINLSASRARCLAFHVHLMKTENHDTLDWPFIGRIRLTLVNLSFPQMSIKDTMMSKPDIGAFQKPSSDICEKGFGFSEYVTIDDLKYKGFIKGDLLVVKIKINQV